MEKSQEKTKTKHDESAAGQSSSVNSTESAIGLNNPLSAARSVVGHAPSQPSTASTLAGAADKKIPASTSTQSKEDRPFLAPRPTSEHLESGHESMDSSDTDTLCGDNNSVVSEESGCTVIGSDLGKLNLTSGFVKMKSAEKRRFKQAMASGHSREKALEIARNASTAKRVRSEESAKETPGGKKPKTSSHVGRPTFSQVASIVRLGIVPSDLAKSPFNKEQLVLIQETVIDVMIEVDDNNKPVFEGAIHRNGWLLFLCSNNDTAKEEEMWVRNDARGGK